MVPIFRKCSEVSSEMCSYGLQTFNVRNDLHLINEHLKMGSYTAEVFSVVRIEDENAEINRTWICIQAPPGHATVVTCAVSPSLIENSGPFTAVISRSEI